MTFTLIARCRLTGQLGAATATKFLSSGAYLLLARPGVGLCASQGFLNPRIRHLILDDMTKGVDIDRSMKARVAEDPFAVLRQVMAISWTGLTAWHSGEGCLSESVVVQGKNHLAAGNWLANGDVVREMSRVFETTQGTLAFRLMAALVAAQEAGGEARGARSAALCVHDDEPYPVVDLRIDDADDPIEAIRNLFGIYLSTYESVTRRLPSNANPSGVLGPVPTARLKEMALKLQARGEAIPESWEKVLRT